MPSRLPLVIFVLSGEKATELTSQRCPRKALLKELMVTPVAASQMRTVPSPLPLAIFVPSGEKATDLTVPVFPAMFLMDAPVAASQMRTVES
jgi:hypothetical protein